jgi:hypothetical protein
MPLIILNMPYLDLEILHIQSNPCRDLVVEFFILPRYNFPAKKLFKRLAMIGGTALLPRGDGDDQHHLGYFSLLSTIKRLNSPASTVLWILGSNLFGIYSPKYTHFLQLTLLKILQWFRRPAFGCPLT